MYFWQTKSVVCASTSFLGTPTACFCLCMEGENTSPDIVLPGDDVTDTVQANSGPSAGPSIIGPGLRREGDKILAIKGGFLKSRKNTFWVDSYQRRYVATKGDRVIGVVVNKAAFHCKVDIGTNEPATLSLLAFEGVTKKSKPSVKVGDVVYAQVLTGIKFMEAELVCINKNNKSDGMGLLGRQGFVVTVPLEVARRLNQPKCSFFKDLGKKLMYEVAVGMNGRVWVNANSVVNTIAICNLLTRLEHYNYDKYDQLTDQVLQEFQAISG